MTLAEALRDARQRLVQALGLDASVAGLEAQVLLGFVLNQPRAHLLTYPDALLSETNQTQFAALLSQRERGEPIAYLTGQREFYGLVFSVTPDVLIPRPETELLVELALRHIPHSTPVRVLDLGTGSGAIAITLAKLRPQALITALDISPRALAIAGQNATQLGVSTIQFLESDWFAQLHKTCQFDLIVANPPYVAEGDPHLAQGDVRFEPIRALTSGTDGMDAIRAIAQASLGFLSISGHLLFEHGYNQAALSQGILHSLGYKHIESHQDLSGQPRVSGGVFSP